MPVDLLGDVDSLPPKQSVLGQAAGHSLISRTSGLFWSTGRLATSWQARARISGPAQEVLWILAHPHPLGFVAALGGGTLAFGGPVIARIGDAEAMSRLETAGCWNQGDWAAVAARTAAIAWVNLMLPPP